MKQRKILKWLCCLAAMFFVGSISCRTVEASEPPFVSDLFSGGSVSGNIMVDGDLQDWENVPGIYVGANGIDSWKVAVSTDKSTFYLCMNGVAVSEWDYNFQWKVLSFTAGDQIGSYQFGSLTSSIPGAQVVMKNGASGNVQGDYAVECSIPVSALPASNFLISLENTNIWAVDVPVLDGMIKEPEDTPIPVYNGITIDGSFSDWAAVAKADGNCPSKEHPDCLEHVAMVFDGDYVYLYLESGDASNAFWSGSHSNAKFAITTDLGYTLLFTMNSDDTVSGVDGAGCKHYGNQAEIAIPKSVLPEYLKSISFGFYQQEPMISDVVNLVAEEEKGSFTGIVYDGLYGDWKYYPHQLIGYATAGTQENVVDGEGALYTDGDTLFGHVKVVMNAHMNEWSTLFTQAVTFQFGEADSLVLYPRFITVDANGNINWNPEFYHLANGTYEYYISSTDAWGNSANISNLTDGDKGKLYGKMMVTITDTSRECEFYLELDQVAEKLGCSPEEFKVIKAQFGRIGQQWLITAGASSGALLGVFICLASVAGVLGFRKIRKGTAT